MAKRAQIRRLERLWRAVAEIRTPRRRVSRVGRRLGRFVTAMVSTALLVVGAAATAFANEPKYDGGGGGSATASASSGGLSFWPIFFIVAGAVVALGVVSMIGNSLRHRHMGLPTPAGA